MLERSTFRAGHRFDEWELPMVGGARHAEVLEAVAEYGVAIVSGVAASESGTEEVVDLFGVARESDVGHLRELVDDDGLAMDPQTTEPYRYMPPGIMVLHCVDANSTGGDIVLVDGFAIAAHLQDDDPDAFDALTQLQLPFQGPVGSNDAAHTGDYRAVAPVISLDRDYEVCGVRFSEDALAPLDLDAARLEECYRALITFTQAANDPGRSVMVTLKPGQSLVFDNQRVLHGCTGFIASGGRRHMRLATVDRDDFHSKLRELRAVHRPDLVGHRVPRGCV